MTEGFKVTLQPDCIHTDYKDDQMTHQQSEEEEQKKQHRRGILKAVAGVPVIFTLSAGTNVAAASISCKEKNQAALPTPGGVSATSDTWIRYKVQKQSITITNTNNGNVVQANNAFTLDNIKWYRANVSTHVVNPVNPLRAISNALPVPGQFYYLLVDHSEFSSGANPENFVYLGTENSASDPVAGGSCWTSLTGITTNTGNVIN